MLVKEEPNEKISRFKRRENAVSTHESLFACRFGAFFSLFFIPRCILVPRSFRPMAFFFLSRPISGGKALRERLLAIFSDLTNAYFWSLCFRGM